MPKSKGSFLGRVGDRVAWGDNIGADGKFHATPGQLIGGIGSRALNFVVPGLGTAVNAVGNGAYGSGPLAKVFDFFQGGGNPGPVSRTQFPVTPGGLDFGGWMGPTPGTGTPDGFNPALGVGGGLDAAQNGGGGWGAFTPNFGAFGGNAGGGYGAGRGTNSAGFSDGGIPLSEYGQFAQNNAGESAIRNMQYKFRRRA